MIMGDLVRLCSVTVIKLKILHDHGRSVGGMQGMFLGGIETASDALSGNGTGVQWQSGNVMQVHWAHCLLSQDRSYNPFVYLFQNDFLFVGTNSVTLYLCHLHYNIRKTSKCFSVLFRAFPCFSMLFWLFYKKAKKSNIIYLSDQILSCSCK